MIFSPRLIKAINFAARAHSGQEREVSGGPYISHPYAVGMILSRAGFPEDMVIAGLLHDVVEDTDISPDVIRQEFGSEVARLVEAVTDPQDMPFEEHALYQCAKFKHAPPEVKALKAADLLHNMNDAWQGLTQGIDFWAVFNRTREQGLWKYQEVLKALRDGWDHPLLEEIEDCLKKIEKF